MAKRTYIRKKQDNLERTELIKSYNSLALR